VNVNVFIFFSFDSCWILEGKSPCHQGRGFPLCLVLVLYILNLFYYFVYPCFMSYPPLFVGFVYL